MAFNKLNWWKGTVRKEYIKYYGNTIPIEYPPPSRISEITSSDMDELWGIPNLFLADALWKVVPIEDVDTFMRLNPVSEEKYISELHDCDDFSQETVVDLKRWVKGYAAFEIWLKSIPHSVVLVFDINTKLWVYEGQSDKRTPCDIDDIRFLR